MYSGPLFPAFTPDESRFRHKAEREEYQQRLQSEARGLSFLPDEPAPAPQTLEVLLKKITPEDSAILGLILFLLSDPSDPDPILIGILLYLLLADP